MEKPNLSEFVDYRRYLEAFYQMQKEQTSGRLRPYSYSDFSAAANIKSPNYLKLIIEGKRNLSREMCSHFSRALGHTRSETKEFELLVRYCQEKDPMQRNQNLKELSEYRAKRSIASGAIDAQTWNHVSDWLVWVLYAMVDQKDVRFTPASLCRLLQGQANEAQVEQALKKLTDNGDIEIDPQTHKARRLGQTIQGIDNIPAELIRKIQSDLAYLGLESLHRYGAHEREMSGFTLAMTEKEFEWVRFELRKLRKQIQKEIAIKREQIPGDRVYQLNVQLFPLSEKGGDATEEKAKKNPLRP